MVIVGLSGLGLPSASATHWCDSVHVATNPSTVYAGDRVDFGLTLTNGFASQVNANLRLRFGWESQTLNWGSTQIPPGASRTNSYSKIITQDPADYAVAITLIGEAGDGNPEGSTTCPTTGRTLRVEPLPPGPVVIASLSHTAGHGPLTVSFSARVAGGLAPFSYEWRFGDGAISTSRDGNHTFESLGALEIQVIVVDARGRVAVDRVTVRVVPASAGLETTEAPAGASAPRLEDQVGSWAWVGGLVLSGALVAAMFMVGSTMRGIRNALSRLAVAEPSAGQEPHTENSQPRDFQPESRTLGDDTLVQARDPIAGLEPSKASAPGSSNTEDAARPVTPEEIPASLGLDSEKSPCVGENDPRAESTAAPPRSGQTPPHSEAGREDGAESARAPGQSAS